MAQKKYSDFTAVTTLADGDMLPLETAGGLTRRILWSVIKTLILAFTRPVGSYYVQYPNEASSTLTTAFPDTQAPGTLFGGSWTLMYSTEGIVFQTEGYDGAGRTNGLMEDQFQGHIHQQQSTQMAGSLYRILNSPNRDGGGYPDGTYTLPPTADGINGTPRTGTRTAHRNRLFRVYRRDA